MKGIFNTNVTQHKPVYETLEDRKFRPSDYHADQLVEKQIQDELEKERVEQAAEIEEAVKESIMAHKKALRDKPAICAEYSAKVSRMIARTVVENLLLESLVIDEDAVGAHEEEIRDIVVQYDSEKPIIDRIAEAIKSEPTPVLTTIHEGCKRVERNVFNKLMESDAAEMADELFEEPSRHQYASEIEKIEADADAEDISNIVKDKVVQVVKDEKKIEEREEEIQQQLEKDLMENEDVVDEETLQEAYAKIVIPMTPVKDKTLFRALIENAYMEALKENVYNRGTTIERDVQSEDLTQTVDDLNASQTELSHEQEHDLELMNKSQTMTDYIENNSEDVVINMEAVMADAIVDYTMLEVLNTIRLEAFTYDGVKTLISKLSARQ